MRPMEQITIEEVTRTMTLADLALYGGLLAVGFALGVYVYIKYGRK